MVNGADQHEHRGLRERRATSAAVTGIAFQGVYALGQFVVMALLFRYLSPQRFGMWLTIYSLTAWAAFAKFGLQYAMYTALGHSALTDRAVAQRVLTNASSLVAVMGFLLTVALLVFGWWLPWSWILNVTDATASNEASVVSVVALAIAAMSMPMLMGGHAMQASQRGAVTQSIGLLVQLVMIIAVTLGVMLRWPLAALAAVVVSPPLIAGAMQWVVGLRTGILPRPARSALDTAEMRRLLAAGVLFLVLDVATITLLQCGPIIVSHLRSPEAVVPYGAAYRLIGLLIAAFMMVSYAYWPAYSEASKRDDTVWIKRGLRRSVAKVLVLWALGAAVILAIGRPFIAWWLGAEAVPGWGTLIAAVVSALTYGLYVMVCTPLSGMGRLRPQIVTAAIVVGIYAVVGVGLCAAYGPAGLFVGQSIAAIVGAMMNAAYLSRVLNQSQAEHVPA